MKRSVSCIASAVFLASLASALMFNCGGVIAGFTVAAKAGDTIELFGTGFGPTTPAVPAGQALSGVAPTMNPVTIRINNVTVTPTFAGLSSAAFISSI